MSRFHPVPIRRFNPRPHTTGDGHGGRVFATAEGVSIHARTRRATEFPRPHVITGRVSIHARTRRATLHQSELEVVSLFQSTPAHDGRPVSLGGGYGTGAFQSTPAHDGRRWHFRHNPHPVLFQSTPAHDGRRAIASAWGSSPRTFQSTPAHDGRHPRPLGRGAGAPVSIHARTRRATTAAASSIQKTFVSIHARTRRATSWRKPRGFGTASFNPRPHTTGDACPGCSKSPGDCFNPRPHTTGDGGIFGTIRTLSCFNPRPHTTGDDNRLGFPCKTAASFNPRPHTTGDARPRKICDPQIVSIHARTRRAT